MVNVKGAFLHGKFDDGEKFYIKIPLGFVEFYDNNTVLLLALMDLNKWRWHFTGSFSLQQLKLDSSTFLLIHAYTTNGKGELVIMISWINDNMIVGPLDLVLKLKSNLMEQIDVTTVESSQSTLGTSLNALVKMRSNWFRLF